MKNYVLQLLRWRSGRAFASHAGDWGFDPWSGQIQVLLTGSDSSTAKGLTTGMSVSVTGPPR